MCAIKTSYKYYNYNFKPVNGLSPIHELEKPGKGCGFS